MVSRLFRILKFVGFGAFVIYVYVFKNGTLTNSLAILFAVAFLSMGFVFNLTALVLNRGFMPVRGKIVPENYQSTYKLVDNQTRAWFLGDWIPTRWGYCSPGDICLAVSFVFMVIEGWALLFRSIL